MNCEVAQRDIVLFSYGELADDASHDLEQHLRGCEACRKELEVTNALRQVMQLAPMEEPSANLLAKSRMQLDEALDELPRLSLMARLENLLTGWAMSIRTAPVMAVVLVTAGFATGGLAGRKWATAPLPSSGATVEAADQGIGTVQSVSSVVPVAGGSTVQVHFNRVSPQIAEGSVDDPVISKLLMAATHDGESPVVENAAIKLLTEQCAHGGKGAVPAKNANSGCDSGAMLDALMGALRYGGNASVRRTALNGLQPYIRQNTRVRDAVLESMLHDSNQEMRSIAINMIEPVQADSSVRVVLGRLAEQDTNPAIRTASMKMLQQDPDIQ